MNNDQDLTTLDFAEDTVTYAEHTFPTGTLACLALNTPLERIAQLRELTPPLTTLKNFLSSDAYPEELVEPAKTSIHAIFRLMQDQPPFCYLNLDRLFQAVDALFLPELIAVYPKTNNLDREAMHKPGMAQVCLLAETFRRYICLLENLPYALEQYLDGVTEFALALDILTDRKPEGLARAVSQKFPLMITLGEDESWMAAANLTGQYYARNNERGAATIMRRYHYESLVGMLRADLFEGLAVGHAPKKCAHCGRWFLTTNGRHTKYCDGIDPNSDKGVSCRNAGNRKAREHREKAQDDPNKALYNSRCDSIRKRIDREKLDSEIGAQAKILAKNKLNKAVQDVDYAQNRYEAEMELDALISEATREVVNARI